MRGDAETEEAGVIAGKLALDSGEIGEVLVRDLTQLRVLLPGRAAADGEDGVHFRTEQAFLQNALPHHARCSEQNCFHAFSEPVIWNNSINYMILPTPGASGPRWPDWAKRHSHGKPKRRFAFPRKAL